MIIHKERDSNNKFTPTDPSILLKDMEYGVSKPRSEPPLEPTLTAVECALEYYTTEEEAKDVERYKAYISKPENIAFWGETHVN